MKVRGSCFHACAAGTFVAAAVWWSLAFALLTYPEIRRNTEFLRGICTITSGAQVVPYRHCGEHCSGCSEFGAGQSCSSVLAEAAKVDRYDVSPSTLQRFSVACGGGYYCCHTCCSTCQRCSQSCSRRLSSHPLLQVVNEDSHAASSSAPSVDDEPGASGASSATALPRDAMAARSCHTTCTTYQCNCYCCSSVSNRACGTSCVPWYEVHVGISLELDGDAYQTTDIYDFEGDHSAASSKAASPLLQANATSACYVDPDWTPGNPVVSPSQLAFQDELGYTAGYWVLLAFPSAIIVLVLAAYTKFLLRRRAVDDSSTAWGLTWVVWVGVLLPLIVFLPIRAGGKLTDANRAGLDATICALLALGWAPAVAVGVRRALSSRRAVIAAVVCVAFVLPLGALVPAALARAEVSGGLDGPAPLALIGAALLLMLCGFGAVLCATVSEGFLGMLRGDGGGAKGVRRDKASGERYQEPLLSPAGDMGAHYKSIPEYLQPGASAQPMPPSMPDLSHMAGLPYPSYGPATTPAAATAAADAYAGASAPPPQASVQPGAPYEY